jgi:cell division protein FtsI (penicillin-binding protein 3)
MLVVAFFIFWIGAIGVRLVHLQVNQHDSFRKKAVSQRRDVVKSKMLRGTIYDRNERPLAMSVKVKSLYVDPGEIDDVTATSNRIAKVLKVNRNKIAKRIEKGKKNGKRFVWIARKLNEETVDKINNALNDKKLKKYDLPRFKGLHWTVEQKRSYPYKTMAAHVIGFSNSDDAGQAGIELSQEAALRGEVTKTTRQRDRLGRVYDEWKAAREESSDVVLTISNSIQYKVEEALARGVRKANAKSGKAIVLNPKTGEILAMANYPSFDPNKFRKLKSGEWRNRSIQDNYAPGSVFKLVTYAAALEEKLIKPDDEIDCGEGTITVAKHTFNDSHSVGNVTYTRAFAESSNVGAIKTAMKVGENTFYRYAREFGFGAKIGVELPAEAAGLLRSPKRWNGDSLASMSIGYEIGVTALQSATAFATIANDGVKVQPHIIKEIRKADGELISTTEPEKVPVVSAGTAENLRKMLREVVLNGTARRAQLKGYTSAGKTGTAWKYDAKLKAVNRNKYVSSFIGFAPAENPEVVIAVVMDEPKGTMRYGGQVAAPVFREIAEQVLPELNVVPDGTLPSDFVVPQPPLEEDEAASIEKRPVSDANNNERRNRSKVPRESKPIKPPKAGSKKAEKLKDGKHSKTGGRRKQMKAIRQRAVT